MLLDPLTGLVLDYVGGQKDLQARIIRTIGQPELRFAEDKLRMLRAVRFAARFGYLIEPGTLAAIQKLAPGIHQVSRERVRDELTKMLTEGHAREAFLLLDQTGLLKEVLPEIVAMKGIEQPPEFHPEGDVFVHTLLLLEKLPLMSNGKVDRHALPAPEHTRQELEQDYVAPRNEVEEKLAAIFSEVLGVAQVGVEDNFFLLGGHSLSATQVIIRILDVLQTDVPLRRIFETPTVAGLALAVEQSQGQSEADREEDRIEVISRPGAEETEPLETLLGQLSSEELQALLLEVAARKRK